MIEEKVAWWKIDSIYLAVRSAEAQSAWDDNKRAKDAGQMPSSPNFLPVVSASPGLNGNLILLIYETMKLRTALAGMPFDRRCLCHLHCLWLLRS